FDDRRLARLWHDRGVRVALFAVVLCACYAPRYHVPADASGDAASSVDVAGGSDAIVDAVAATCTPVGHDEDGDGIDDACDPCPHDAAGGMADADGDGVGDACDPEPAIPRQKILFFDPFTSVRPEWDAGTDVSNGKLHLTNGIAFVHVPTGELRIVTG